MDIKDLQEERERIVQEFITAMNEWLEKFNDYTDKLIQKSEEAEKVLEEIKNG